MSKLLAIFVAAVFTVAAAAPAAFAQDQKKEQVHKGTPAQGTVQKKEHAQAQKKDGSGGTMKKGEGKKAEPKKEEKK